MNEAVGYIFTHLRGTEKIIGSVLKNLKLQKTFNSRVCAFAVATSAFTVVAAKQMIEQEKKIKKIEKELEELKQTKGE